MDKAKMKIVYAITTRPLNATHRTEAVGTRKYWNRIGIAFVNGDGSLNVKLEALPVSGELHIRDFVPHDEAKPVHRPSGNNQPALKRAAA
jgi:hypothetical protein